MAAFTFGVGETQTTNTGSAPHVAALSSGGYVITWQGTGQGDDFGVFAQRYLGDGTPVGSAVAVNTTTVGQQGGDKGPIVAGLVGGGYVVVWSDKFGTASASLREQVFASDGTKVGGETVIDATIGPLVDPAVAALANGGFVVTWDDMDLRAKEQVFGATGLSSGAVRNVSRTAGQEHSESVAVLNDGRFAIAWEDDSGASPAVTVRLFTAAGATNSADIQITDTVAEANPSISALPNGNFVVAWEAVSGASHMIHAQIYDLTGAKVGAQISVSAKGAVASAPTVVGLDNGGFFVTWDQLDSGGEAVYGRNFTPAGAADGSATAINISAVSGASPDAVQLASGRIIDTWSGTSTLPNGSVQSRLLNFGRRGRGRQRGPQHRQRQFQRHPDPRRGHGG